MEYLIKHISGSHLRSDEQLYQIPHKTNPSDCDNINGVYWYSYKPTKGIRDLNAAYRRLEFLHQCHEKCCKFEVIEV